MTRLPRVRRLAFLGTCLALGLLGAGALRAQTIDFCHGTDFDAAKWIYENRLTPYTLEALGAYGVNDEAPWGAYTDFGKGFYTHPPGPYQFPLAKDWAIKAARKKCGPGQRDTRWGVVYFHVDPALLRPIDVGAPARALYFLAKHQSAWNAPWSYRNPGYRQTWLEFIEINRHRERWSAGLPRIQRPGDYDYSAWYAWIQGPIWVPRDSGIDAGPPLFPESIHQRNWLQQGLDAVLNDARTVRRLYGDVVPCAETGAGGGGGGGDGTGGGAASGAGYGVFLAGDDVLVGRKAELEAIRTCNLRGWGVDCNRTVGQAVALRLVAGPFGTLAEATAWYCGQIEPGSHFRPPLASFLVGAKLRFDGKNHMITNAPACGR